MRYDTNNHALCHYLLKVESMQLILKSPLFTKLPLISYAYDFYLENSLRLQRLTDPQLENSLRLQRLTDPQQDQQSQ